jgi:Ni/Fe-hydrogenase subunit HybB-like protein
MRRVFIRSSWVPPALWVATLIYLRGYDGWGAWAAAPLLLPAFVLSAVWGGLGALLVGQAAVQNRRADLPVLAATVLSGGAALYYTLRALLR